MLGGCLPCWPPVSAQVARLGSVDSPKPVRHAIDPKGVAISHAAAVRLGASRYRCAEGLGRPYDGTFAPVSQILTLAHPQAVAALSASGANALRMPSHPSSMTSSARSKSRASPP
jgi:hypothetical protein